MKIISREESDDVGASFLWDAIHCNDTSFMLDESSDLAINFEYLARQGMI